MDRTERTDPNRKALRRVVMMLLALADLADRASLRCAVVRWSVLWLLLPGEAIARDYVAALTQDPRLAGSVAAPQHSPARDSAADAMRLAATFRTLAAILLAFLEGLVATIQVEFAGARVASPTGDPAGAMARRLGHRLPIERRDSS